MPGEPCGIKDVAFDKNGKIFPASFGDERFGIITSGRVIAEHPTSDIAIIQTCTVGKPIFKYKDCKKLKFNDRIYTVGSSTRYGHTTWLLGSFQRCNDDSILYVMPGEWGRSGSPLILDDGALVGIHENAGDGEYRVGVPVQKALELMEGMKVRKLVGIQNRTGIRVHYFFKCSQDGKWGTRSFIEANQSKMLWCEYDAYGSPDRSMPRGFHIRFEASSAPRRKFGEYELKYISRYVISSSVGGTELKYDIDFPHYTFDYKVENTTVELFGWRLDSSGGRPILLPHN